MVWGSDISLRFDFPHFSEPTAKRETLDFARPTYAMAPSSVSLCWAPGERLLVSAGTAPTHNIEARQPLPRPFLNLFFAGHLIFLNHVTPVVEKSEQYRAIILDCRDSLNRLASTIDKTCEDLLNSLSHAHTIWHFVEAVFLMDHVNTDQHISAFLAEWFMVNYPDISEQTQRISERAESERPDDDDEELWNFFIKLAIVGDVEKVHQLLSVGNKEEDVEEKWPFGVRGMEDQLSSEAPLGPTPIVTTVRRLLDRAPSHNISTRSDGSWERWQADCAVWADSDEMSEHDGAKRLLGLFSGDPDKIAHACSKWEEMLVACSFYAQFGHATGGNLRGGIAHVSSCCAAATATFTAPDDIAGGALVEAALGNLSNAIVRVQASLPSSWFSAHLCDLLMKVGLLEDVPTASWGADNRPMGMREFYLKEFARGLERYPGFWRIAVDYYMGCLAHGPSLLIDLLTRVPFDGPSDPKVEKVLLICAKKKLRRTANNVCEKIGADCLSERNLGGAMSWFARGGVFSRAQGVAEMALISAEREGANSQAAKALECVVCAVMNIGNNGMKEMFDYLRDYCKMQRALVNIAATSREDSEMRGNTVISRTMEEQADDIVSPARRLVGGGGLPRRFWIVVTYEVARALELYPHIVSFIPRVAVSELLSALQLASGPHCPQEMTIGLRGRLAFEGHVAGDYNSGVELCSVEDAEDALNHCRSVLIRTAAARNIAK